MASSVLAPIKGLVHALGRKYIDAVVRSEADAQTFKHYNERPVEFSFALRAIAERRPKTVCDVGTGDTAFPHLLRNCGCVVTAIDNVRDYWDAGMVNRHWPVQDVDITNLNGFGTRRFDAVTCISVLEHIKDHQVAVANMASILNPGGLLIVTTPFSRDNPHENVYTRSDSSYRNDGLVYPCRSSSQRELDGWLSLGLKLEKAEYWRMWSGPVWTSGERVDWKQTRADESHQLGCFAFVKGF
jgi:SAM-dependent methyltransferase